MCLPLVCVLQKDEEGEAIMATGSSSRANVCPTCGKVTTKKGHLCTPVDTKTDVCEFCGQASPDPRHICFPKQLELKYYCAACGRVALTRSALCKSRIISKPKVAPAPKTAKKK